VDYCYEHEGENVSDPDGWLPRAIDVLNAWDYNADADAEEVALARLWIEEINRQTGGVSLLDPIQPEDLTVEEMRGALELLIHTAETMYSTYGTLTIPWGDIHVFQRGDKILPLSGAGHIFHPLHMAHGPISDDGIMYCDGGSSYMMLVQLSDPVRALKAIILKAPIIQIFPNCTVDKNTNLHGSLNRKYWPTLIQLILIQPCSLSQNGIIPHLNPILMVQQMAKQAQNMNTHLLQQIQKGTMFTTI
jgi:hypothetical protein